MTLPTITRQWMGFWTCYNRFHTNCICTATSSGRVREAQVQNAVVHLLQLLAREVLSPRSRRCASRNTAELFSSKMASRNDGNVSF